jgi:hypothetical protein
MLVVDVVKQQFYYLARSAMLTVYRVRYTNVAKASNHLTPAHQGSHPAGTVAYPTRALQNAKRNNQKPSSLACNSACPPLQANLHPSY